MGGNTASAKKFCKPNHLEEWESRNTVSVGEPADGSLLFLFYLSKFFNASNGMQCNTVAYGKPTKSMVVTKWNAILYLQSMLLYVNLYKRENSQQWMSQFS